MACGAYDGVFEGGLVSGFVSIVKGTAGHLGAVIGTSVLLSVVPQRG